MREILFRGKRVDNGEWVYGYYIKAEHHWHEKGIHEDWIITRASQNGGWFTLQGRHAVIPETIGQYTGLTDKNGTKIFEGDVVKIEHNDYAFDGMTLEYRKEKGVIAYDNIGLIGLVVGKHEDENVWSDFFNVLALTDQIESWSFEVIGNIHDNPELIGGE